MLIELIIVIKKTTGFDQISTKIFTTNLTARKNSADRITYCIMSAARAVYFQLERRPYLVTYNVMHYVSSSQGIISIIYSSIWFTLQIHITHIIPNIFKSGTMYFKYFRALDNTPSQSVRQLSTPSMDAGLVDEQSTLNNTKNSGSYETISPDDNALIADQNFLAVYPNFFSDTLLVPILSFSSH